MSKYRDCSFIYLYLFFILVLFFCPHFSLSPSFITSFSTLPSPYPHSPTHLTYTPPLLIYIHTHTRTHTYPLIHIYTHTHIHTHTNPFIHTEHTLTYIHSHTYTHTAIGESKRIRFTGSGVGEPTAGNLWSTYQPTVGGALPLLPMPASSAVEVAALNLR